MDEITNLIRREVRRVLDERAEPRMGRISSYDDGLHAVKVEILPEADFPLNDGEVAETGWIPLSPLTAGNGIGVYAPPLIGTQVHVSHQEDNAGSGLVVSSINDQQNPPPPGIQPGEFWVVNQKDGSFLKITNDGNFSVQVHGTMNITVVNGNANITVAKGDANINAAAGDANLLAADRVNLGAVGGLRVARDGDKTSDGATIIASTDRVFSA